MRLHRIIRALPLILTCSVLFGPFTVRADEIRIGVSLPLSGEAASYGEDTRKALLFALERSGRRDLKLIFEDDRCTGKGAVAVAEKLTTVDRVKTVIGPVCSGAILAAAPVYEKEKVVVLGVAASAPAISQAGRFIFRLAPNDAVSSRMLADHVTSSGTKSIGILSEQTEYCEGFREGFSGALKSAAVRTVEEIFNPGTTDFRGHLLRLKRAGVEALFVNAQSDRTFSTAVKQLAQLHWSPKLYAAYWPSSLGVLESLGPLAEGIEFVDLPSPQDFLSSEGRGVFDELVRKTGKPESSPIIPPLALEAFNLALRIQGQADPVQFLESVEHEGLLGKYHFDRNGDLIEAPIVLNRIESGHPVKLRAE